jgi:hypothetical protein
MTATAPEPKAPSWEDYIEIFYAPSRVFARRGTRWGGPLLVLVVAAALVIFGTYSLLRPLYEAEGQRAMAGRLQEMTAEQRAQMERMSGKFGILAPVTMAAFHAIVPLVLGIVLWLVGKTVGAVQELGSALMVGAFSYFPRVLAWPLYALQTAVLPEEKVRGFANISFSPARLVDLDTTGLATVALLSRLDIFVLWTTFLLALGLKVTGKISTEKAVIAGVVMWVLGTLQPLIAYLRS